MHTAKRWRAFAWLALGGVSLGAWGAVPVVTPTGWPGAIQVGWGSSRPQQVVVGYAFKYLVQGSSSNPVTGYDASGLPAGLTIDRSTGWISGAPAAAGNFAITLTATNSEGNGTANVTLTVQPAPTSAPVVTAPAALDTVYRGSSAHDMGAYIHDIVLNAANAPTRFAATGLPPRGNLMVDPNGAITYDERDVPPGRYTVTVSATNAVGTGSATFDWQHHPRVRFIDVDKTTYGFGESIVITATFDSPVVVTGTPYIPVRNGTRRANYVSGSSSDRLLFRCDTLAADGPFTEATAQSITLDGGTIAHVSGVSATLSVAADIGSGPRQYSVGPAADTTAPTIVRYEGTSVISAPARFDIVFSEPVTGVTAQLFTATAADGLTATGSPVLTASDSTGTAYRITVPFSGVVGNMLLTLGSAANTTIKDSAGNALSGTVPTMASRMQVSVVSVTPPPAGNYFTGANLDFTVNFTAPVTVTGTPVLPMDFGTPAQHVVRQATYRSGSGTTALTFRYTVDASDRDTDGITVSVLDYNGATIVSSIGSPVNGLFARPATGSVLINPVTTTAHPIALLKPAPGVYRTGNILTFGVRFSERVTFTGTPRVALQIGSATRFANVRWTYNDTIVFAYTAVAGDSDADGISMANTIDLNGGTLTSASGAPAGTSFDPVELGAGAMDLSAVRVDATPAPASAPVIAAATVTGIADGGSTLVYTPIVSGGPTGFSAQGLPSGIAANTVSGVLANSGNTPTRGSYAVTLTATNASGSGNAPLTLVLAPYPQSRLPDANDVRSVGTPPNGTYRTGDTLTFTVNAAGAVVVGTPRLPLTIGSRTRYASYVPGESASRMLFRYTVASDDVDEDGIGISSAIELDGLLMTTEGWQCHKDWAFAPDTAGIRISATTSPVVVTTPTPPPAATGGATTPTPTAGTTPPPVVVSPPTPVATTPTPVSPPAVTPATPNPTVPPTPAVTPVAQTITFDSPVSSITVGLPIALGARSSAGLPITYSVVSGEATIEGATITPRSTAELIVRAASSGNETVAAAATDVNFGRPQKATQSIALPTMGDVMGTATPIVLNSTTSAGLPITYTVSGPATMQGGSLVFTGAAGTVTVRAASAGNDLYAPADLSRSFAVRSAARLVNLSARLRVAGNDTMRAVVAGFVVTGSEAKPMLIRAIGPGLSGFGVAGALANPRLQIYNGAGTLVAENDDWGGNADIAAAAERVGAFRLEGASRDAAILANLSPGAYTAQIVANGESGVALIEVYDAASASGAAGPQEIANLSTRGFVDTGDGALIAGFVVTGDAPKRVLIRGIGPALAGFGVAGAVANPTLKLYVAGSAAVLAQNDDWSVAQPISAAQTMATAAEIADASTAVGAFPLAAGSRDAAMMVTLQPGAYTAVVGGVDNATGAGLVEVYQVAVP